MYIIITEATAMDGMLCRGGFLLGLKFVDLRNSIIKLIHQVYGVGLRKLGGLLAAYYTYYSYIH